MRTKEYILELIDTALNSVQADHLEAGIYNYEQGVTRFANSMIHQNVVKEADELWARVIFGKKIGGISIGSLDKERLRGGMQIAALLAKHQKEDTGFNSLPSGTGVEQMGKLYFVDPYERARCVEKIVSVAKKHNLTAAGVIYSTCVMLGIGNSLGIRSIGSRMSASIDVTVMSADSSGYAGKTVSNFSEMDSETLANIACEKAILSRKPTEISPGKYTVLLEPCAVAELLGFLNYIGFGAKSYHEGTSFMSDKIGKKITGNNITILDDTYHPDSIGFHFDYEGMPKEKVVLIEKGIARNVVYDSYYAYKEGKKSTGHAIPQPNAYGPYPMNIVLIPGDKTREDMLATIRDGILITRFWYTRLIDPDKTLITGMTRDGTFLVKNGKLTKGIKNLRYTVNILETLKNVLLVSKESKLIGSSIVPSLLIKDFNFSGKTEY